MEREREKECHLLSLLYDSFVFNSTANSKRERERERERERRRVKRMKLILSSTD